VGHGEGVIQGQRGVVPSRADLLGPDLGWDVDQQPTPIPLAVDVAGAVKHLLERREREGYGLVVVETLSKGTPVVLVRGEDNASTELIEEGEGFRIAMRILDRSRPGIGAQGLGLAQGATDYALEYAKSRETMGKPIAQHQLIAGMLADMETKCEAARGLLYKCGQLIDEGADGQDLSKISAMAKLYCTDVAMEVTTDAVQILGGYGYIQEYPVERMMRDAKITQIYEGTNQIQRLVIAREMVKEQRASLLAGVG